MGTVKIILHGKEVEIPAADLQWFVEAKGAKLAEKEEKQPKPKTPKS